MAKIKYRAEVIEKSVNLETVISTLITSYFFPQSSIHLKFFSIVLHDQYASFAFKISVLSKCYPKIGKRFFEKLRRIGNIRNIFAHCGTYVHLENAPSGIIDPKNQNKRLDYESLYTEFSKIENEVSQILFEKIKK